MSDNEIKDQCWRAFREGNKEVAVGLLQALEKRNARSISGMKYGHSATLLHFASRHGWLDIVQQLTDQYNCSVKAQNDWGDTPLHLACTYGHIDVVTYLATDCQCDLTSKNRDDHTPLHLASRNGHLLIVEYLITKHNCDPLCGKTRGETPLHCASRSGHLNIVKYIISKCDCNMMCQNRSGNTALHEASLNGHLDIVQFLVAECGCDPMCTGNNDNTPLHYACQASQPHFSVIKYLLSTGQVNLFIKNKSSKTPFMMIDDAHKNEVYNVFKQFDKIKSLYPVDSYVNVALLGNPGAGKSTLAQVLVQTATGLPWFGKYRNVGGVEECTAGIIPMKLQHKKLGNIILYDLAGQPEYYSSHIAVLENILHSSAAVFIIVVNMSEKEPLKHLHHWLTVAMNESQKVLSQCHLLTIISHMDKTDPTPTICEYEDIIRTQLRESPQESIIECGVKVLDCRKLAGSNFSSFVDSLSNACQSIRCNSTRQMSLYCHMLYALLEMDDKSLYTLERLMDIISKSEEDGYYLPQDQEHVIELLSSLHAIGLIAFLRNNERPSDSWIVVRKEILLTEVNGVLFAPENFRQHQIIASNTGIITMSTFKQLFPQYSPEMLLQFLHLMELCQEISPSFLKSTNLLVREGEEMDEKLLFFPALLRNTNRPSGINTVFQFGWCLQCDNPNLFFLPRFLHVLLLHLAYKYILPKPNEGQLNRQCSIWTNGIYWLTEDGVRTLVEMVDNNQCVILLMSCEQTSASKLVELRKSIISEILSLRHQLCPGLDEEREFLLKPSQLEYPIEKPSSLNTFDIADVAFAVITREKYVVDNNGVRDIKINDLLPFESTQIDSISVFAGRKPEVSVMY